MLKDDIIENLLTLGIIAVAGYGIYKILESFGNFNTGDQVTKNEIINSPSSTHYSDLNIKTTSSSNKKTSCGAYYLCSNCGYSEFFSPGKKLICQVCGSYKLIDDDD
jgi:hypothetical protein